MHSQELEKLICFSGTPTVVWRRTGEICLVAPEFMAMTGWSREDLFGQRKYVYEVRFRQHWAWELLLTLIATKKLFENQSVVEYWENFASHAFENTTKTVNSHCVLLKPSGAPIPCTFCFSVRRDLFDLPSLVIGKCFRRIPDFLGASRHISSSQGQWLPLL